MPATQVAIRAVDAHPSHLSQPTTVNSPMTRRVHHSRAAQFKLNSSELMRQTRISREDSK